MQAALAFVTARVAALARADVKVPALELVPGLVPGLAVAAAAVAMVLATAGAMAGATTPVPSTALTLAMRRVRVTVSMVAVQCAQQVAQPRVLKPVEVLALTVVLALALSCVQLTVPTTVSVSAAHLATKTKKIPNCLQNVGSWGFFFIRWNADTQRTLRFFLRQSCILPLCFHAIG